MKNLPKAVEDILAKYIFLVQERLPNQLQGLYLQGSIALDAYSEGMSDLDFVAVFRSHLSEAEVKILREIHRIILEQHKHPEMDGTYVTWGELGNCPESWFYNDGKLSYGHSLNPIAWWILKKKGAAVQGPELEFEIVEESIVSYTYENMNSYWAERIKKIEASIEELKLLSASSIEEELEWTVLGLLRQFYTLKEKDIISKLGAGEYALGTLPDEWHPIIQEAVNIRKGIKSSFYHSNMDAIKEAIRLAGYIFSESASIMR